MPAPEAEIELFVRDILRKAAKSGVHRAELLDHRPSSLSVTDAARAIRVARSRGLYSIPDMKSIRLGAYYQCDSVEES